MVKLIRRNKPTLYNTTLTIRDFYQKRNKVLILRDTGGLGDILMCRMIFEDFKRIMPEAYVVFAVPERYMEAAADHPFVDEVVDSKFVDENEYTISYNITSACGRHETSIAPLADKNRSDIWATHCGIELQAHNMHLNVDPDLTKECRARMEQFRTTESGPVVLFCPVSAMVSKNLDAVQMNGVLRGLQERDCLTFGLHKTKIHELEAPTIEPSNLKQYFAFIHAADYIITVDTASFHVAGGLRKPTVGVFSWADGKVYGKWYPNFVLVQRHRDNGNWSCGPCYQWGDCIKCRHQVRKPCITEITSDEVLIAAEQMMKKWPLR